MSTLTIKQKINLFNKLYKEISGYGRGGDTELAHVNKYEASVLKAMGGSGTVNPLTQLREYGMFDKDGDPPPAPVSTGETTVKNVSDLPEYFKPYAEKLLATAEQVYDEPYEAYTDPVTGEAGKRLADVTDEQKMAFAGLRDLFTEVDPETGERSFKSPMSDEITESKRLAGRGARGFDEFEEGEFSETYMSPYQDAVTKIQVREAERKQEQARQARQSAAGAAGALGGSRFGIQEGVAREGDRRLLSDIELKGLQDAYTQGLTTFDADRSAARQGSNQMLGLGQQEQASNLTGLGALQSTGETQRALRQQPLDLDYEEFVRQKEYPRQSLQELSGILRGFQVQPDTYKTSQNFASPPTLGSQLLTAGSLGAGISSGLGKSLFGKAGGGLASIAPEKYAEGDIVSETVDVDVNYTPLDSTKYGGLKRIQIQTQNANAGYDKFGKPIIKQPSLEQRRKAIEGKYPSIKEQEENLRRTKEKLITQDISPSVTGQVIKKQVDDQLKILNQSGVDESGQDLTSISLTPEQELYRSLKGEGGMGIENLTPTTSLDMDEEQLMVETPEEDVVVEETEGTTFDFAKALPFLKMAAQFSQPGQTTSQAALKALTGYEAGESAKAKAKLERDKSDIQKAYYESLASKSKADALIARRKAGRAVTDSQIKTELESIKLQMDALTKSEAAQGELSKPDQARLFKLNQDLNKLRKVFGTQVKKIEATPDPEGFGGRAEKG